MTFQQLIDIARAQLDDVAEPYLWSDDELITCLNKTLTLFLGETNLYKIKESVNVSSGNHTINLSSPDTVIGVRDVKFDGKILKLLEGHEISYLQSKGESSGTPIFYTFENDFKSIILYPTPDESGTLTYVRISNIIVDMNNLNSNIPFNSSYHLYLVDGILAYAYEKNDVETFRIDQSREFMERFIFHIEKIKKFNTLNSQSFTYVNKIPRGLL